MGKMIWVSLVAAVTVVAPVADAHVTTHGAALHNYNAKEDVDIDYVGQGVRNISTVNERFVVGSVAFSRTNAGSSTFSIDGKNALGKSTVFTLAAYNFGLLRSSVSFTEGPGAGQVGVYASERTLDNLDEFSRVSLLALLPTSSASVIYGVTQRQ